MTDNYPPPPPPPPYTPPPPPPPFGPPPGGEPDGARTGPPWEQPGPPFERFARTAQAVLLEPTRFFSTMRREGGLGQPLVFGIIGTLAGGVIGAIYQMLLSMMGAGFRGGDAGAEVFAGLFSTGCIIVVLPVVTVLSMFIAAGIYHLMLMLLGAAARPFETTMRVIAYGTGSTSLLNVIPICGGFIGALWGIVVAIIGLAQAHEISTGKAAAAVLIPFVACCVLLALFYASIAAMILGGAAMGGWQ
jgi:hypothetical protein